MHPAMAPKTPVTFPEAAAYGFTFSGCVLSDEAKNGKLVKNGGAVQGDVRHPSRAIGVDRLFENDKARGYDE